MGFFYFILTILALGVVFGILMDTLQDSYNRQKEIQETIEKSNNQLNAISGRLAEIEKEHKDLVQALKKKP